MVHSVNEIFVSTRVICHIILHLTIATGDVLQQVPMVPQASIWPSSSFPNSNSPRHHHREGNTRLDTSAELVLGTFAQEQENAWFYETYYPIVLKLAIPDWSPAAHRLDRSAPRCDTDDVTSSYLCPSQQHLDSLLIRLSQSTRFFRNILSASPVASEKDDNIYEENLSCAKIKPHFYHFSTSLKGLQPYLEELRKNCPLAKDLNLIEKTVSSAEMNQAGVRHAYERFTEKHLKYRPNPYGNATFNPNSTNETLANLNMRAKKAYWEFAQMASYTTFQNSFNLFTYAESVKWSNAYTTCQAYRLDVNLIPPSLLMTILDEASKNLTRLGLGYNISIPFDSILTHFYKLPLTDCVLALEGLSEAFLIIRLLIPVTRYYKHYKLMKLNKVPFFIRNTNNEHKEVGSICEIKNYRYEEMFLVEYDTSFKSFDQMQPITAVMKAPPTCAAYHVCRIPDNVHRGLVDTCVEGIISREEEVTKDECGFKCYPVTKKQMEEDFPYVIQLTSNRYAVVGAMINETKGVRVAVICFGRTKVEGLKQEKMDEATIITLPCTCHILIGDNAYYPEYPCNSTLEIIHVTHVVGDGFDGFKLFEGDDKARNIQDTMNGSKGNKNITMPEKEERKDKVLPDEELVEQEEEEPEEEYVFDDDAMFSIPFADNRKSGSGGGNGTPTSDLLVIIDASKGDGYVCTHAIVWVVGFFILISDIAILYTLYKKGYVVLDEILFLK